MEEPRGTVAEPERQRVDGRDGPNRLRRAEKSSFSQRCHYAATDGKGSKGQQRHAWAAKTRIALEAAKTRIALGAAKGQQRHASHWRQQRHGQQRHASHWWQQRHEAAKTRIALGRSHGSKDTHRIGGSKDTHRIGEISSKLPQGSARNWKDCLSAVGGLAPQYQSIQASPIRAASLAVLTPRTWVKF